MLAFGLVLVALIQRKGQQAASALGTMLFTHLSLVLRHIDGSLCGIVLLKVLLSRTRIVSRSQKLIRSRCKVWDGCGFGSGQS
jgi:hypothetical protein